MNLDQFGMPEKKDLVKQWYDGFCFGTHRDIYNPWSITNYLKEKKLRPYWAATSSNGLISKLLQLASVNMKEGIVRLLKKERLTNGIEVEVTEDGVILNFHVIVAYGVSISTVADNLISNVKYKVEKFTGMKIRKINILVEGVRVID